MVSCASSVLNYHVYEKLCAKNKCHLEQTFYQRQVQFETAMTSKILVKIKMPSGIDISGY